MYEYIELKWKLGNFRGGCWIWMASICGLYKPWVLLFGGGPTWSSHGMGLQPRCYGMYYLIYYYHFWIFFWLIYVSVIIWKLILFYVTFLSAKNNISFFYLRKYVIWKVKNSCIKNLVIWYFREYGPVWYLAGLQFRPWYLLLLPLDATGKMR